MTMLTERLNEWHASLKAGHTLEHAEQKALLDAVKKVLALHTPFKTHRLAANGEVAEKYVACEQCDLRWPCPTVAALNEALGVDE